MAEYPYILMRMQYHAVVSTLYAHWYDRSSAHWAHNVVSTRDVTLNQRCFSVDQNLNSSGSRACYVKGRKIDQCQK